MSKLTEKRYNMHLQKWLRGPTMSLYAFAALQMFLHRTTPLPYSWVVLVIVAGLHLVNGVHYTTMAIDTFARHDQMRILDEKKK